MVGTAGAKVGEPLCIGGIHKSQHLGQIAETADHPLRRRNPSAQEGKNLPRQIAMAVNDRMPIASEQLAARALHMVHYKLPQLIDDGHGVQVALALRISPREQTVS